MGFNAIRELTDSEKYAEKFGGVTASEKGDRLVAYYARKAVLDNDGLETEDVYFLNAKSGRLIKHQKLGELGGGIELPKTDGKIIVVHNHPNSKSFSFDDFITLNDHQQIKTMIAAGHNGTVYFLSVGDGKRLLIKDDNAYKHYQRGWQRFSRDLKSGYGAIEKFSEGLGWAFYVK
jgi:hypothetical protein